MPRNATTSRSGQRFYEWRSDRYWSVTTILSGGVPKPALLPWGIKMVAEGAVEAVEKGTLSGMVEQDREGAIRWLKGLPWAARDKAADLGTAIHEAIEAYVLGKPFPTWGPLIVKRMRHVEQFLADYGPTYHMTEASVFNRTQRYAGSLIVKRMRHVEQFLADYGPTYHMTEASVFNRTQRYAGTLDAIATVGGRTLVIDVKSGKAVYPETALQLAAYRWAEFVGAPDGSEQPMPITVGAAVLHLTDEGYSFQHVESGRDVFQFFLYCREVFRWQEEFSKTVIGAEIPLPGSETPEQIELAEAVSE